MSQRKILWASTAAVSAVILAGCGGGNQQGGPDQGSLQETAAPASGPVDSVNWMLSAEPSTMDTDFDGGIIEDTVVANVCERLFEVQPDYTIEPRLAESVDRPDDTTIVYTIRQGVTFHDGREMTAEDVVWSMNRHSEDGADESDEYEGVESIEQTGDNEVTVTLTNPDAQFDMRMAGDGGIVWNRDVIEEAGDDFGTPASPDACTGPYELTEWQAGTSISLNAYEDYWDTERTINTQEIPFTWGDGSAVVNALGSGEVDGAYLAEPSLAQPLMNNDAVTLSYGPTTAAWQLMPARGDGALGDPNIRTALSLAIDREGISTAAFAGQAEPWSTPVGSGAWSTAPETFQAASDAITTAPATPTEDNLNEARALVEEAGDPGPITVATNGSEVATVTANGIRDAAQEVGLTVEIRSLSDAQYSDLFASEDARAEVDGFIGDWYISKPDPLGLLDNVLPGSVNNYLGFEDETFTETFNTAAGEYDDAARAELTVQVQDIYMENMLSIPLIMAPNTLVTNSELAGAPPAMSFLTYPWAADLGAA